MRLAIALFASLLVTGCHSPSKKTLAEEELRSANSEYDKALIAGDAAALDRFYTDDFRIIDDDAGIHDKRSQIELMTKQVDLLHARGENVEVTLLGNDAALVTGRFVGRYRYRGKEQDFTERYTSVWVREGDRWRVKHEHASLAPALQPSPRES